MLPWGLSMAYNVKYFVAAIKRISKMDVTCHFLTQTISLEMAAFWNIAPHILIEVGRSFRGSSRLHHERDGTSSYSRHKNLKSHLCFIISMCVQLTLNSLPLRTQRL
jgi:hypothetical protein